MPSKTAKKKSVPKRKRAVQSQAVAVRKEPKPNLTRQRQVSSGLIKIRDINDPSMVMAFGKVLQKYIKDNDLSVVIAGNIYAKVEAWEFAGSSFGLTAMPRKPAPKHSPGEYITSLYTKEERTAQNGKKYLKEVPFFVGYSRDQLIINDQRILNEGKVSREMTRPHFAYECECDIKRLSDGVLIGYGYSQCSNLEDGKTDFNENSISSMAQTRSIGKAYRNLLSYVMKSAGVEPTPAEEMQTNITYQDANVVAEPAVQDKPLAGPDRFKQICEKMIADKTLTVKWAKEHWLLTPDQEKSLEIIEKQRK